MNLSPSWIASLESGSNSAVHWSSIGSSSALDTEIIAWAGCFLAKQDIRYKPFWRKHLYQECRHQTNVCKSCKEYRSCPRSASHIVLWNLYQELRQPLSDITINNMNIAIGHSLSNATGVLFDSVASSAVSNCNFRGGNQGIFDTASPGGNRYINDSFLTNPIV